MEYLIKVSAILVLFYLCYKFLLNRETFFESNRSFLLLGLIAAFILPFITVSKYITVEPSIVEGSYVFNDTISQSVVVDNSISLSTILTYIYIAGTLFFLGRFLLQFGSLVVLLFNSTKQRVASFIYVITKNMISPFSFFNWIVFNPNQFNETELEQIITHEKVHAKQLHSIDILLAELVCIILWFNPLVWLYKKDLRQNLEFIADKNAQATTNCKKSYQHLLLKTSVPNYQMALTNNFYNSLIKKRIVMLHKNRSKNRNQLKFLLVLPALVLFLMSFNTKEIYIEAKSSNETASTITQEAKTIATASNKPAILKDKSKPITTSKKTVANNNTVKSNTILAQDIVAYFIESTFTDDKLDDVISKLKTHGITLKIKGVKRNSDNEITAIKIDAKSKNSNANFSISNDDAVKTIKIAYNKKDDSISIGNSNNLLHDSSHVFTHKDGVVKIKKSGKGSNAFVYSIDDEHDGEHEIIQHDDKIIIKRGNKVHELKKEHINKNIDSLRSSTGWETKFIVDKTMSKEGNKVIHSIGTNSDSINKSPWKVTVGVNSVDSIKADGKIFKLKENAIVNSKNKTNALFVTSGENGELIELKGEGNEDGDIMFIRKDKDGNIEEKVKAKGNLFTFESEDGKIFKSKATERSDAKIWISKDDNEGKTITKIGKNGGTMFYTSDSDKKPLLVIDGKVVKNKKLEDIDVDNVRSMNVLKGKSAEKKYGKKGKDGVIEITLKKKKD